MSSPETTARRLVPSAGPAPADRPDPLRPVSPAFAFLRRTSRSRLALPAWVDRCHPAAFDAQGQILLLARFKLLNGHFVDARATSVAVRFTFSQANSRFLRLNTLSISEWTFRFLPCLLSNVAVWRRAAASSVPRLGLSLKELSKFTISPRFPSLAHSQLSTGTSPSTGLLDPPAPLLEATIRDLMFAVSFLSVESKVVGPIGPHRPLNQTARAVFPQAAFLSCSSFGIRCVAAGGGFVRTAFGSFAKGTIQVHDISAFPIARTFPTEYGDFPLQRAFWTRQRRCSKQRSETLCLPSRSSTMPRSDS